MEGLWRHVKGRVLANEPTPDLGDSLGRVCEELFEMTGTERRRLAGVLSGNFWLPTQARTGGRGIGRCGRAVE